MFTVPLDYSEINLLAGTYTPSTVKKNSKAFLFWFRALYQRICSVIEYENFPDDWKENLDKWCEWLYLHGFLAITEDNRVGTFFNKCTFYGFNLYYKPTNITITNPALPTTIERTLNVDSALIKMSPDYHGVIDIIALFAEKLALLDSAQNVCLINSKIPFYFSAKSKAGAETLKKMIDKVNAGEPIVITDLVVADDPKSKDSPFHFFKLFEGSDYITDKLLQDTATVLNQFDTEIGIKTLPYQKAERLVTSEAESKQEESLARVTTWVNEINNSLAVANKLFNLNIKATIKNKGGENNGNIDSMGNREFSQISE